MVGFRICLNLHNYKKLSAKYSHEKTKKILRFYTALGNLIKRTHNYDIKRTQKQFKQYSEPLIEIRKNIFNGDSKTHDPLQAFLNLLCPPTIDIYIDFKLSKKREEIALRQFFKDYKDSLYDKSYKELRTLYYSTKIVQFVSNLRSLINENVLWKHYLNKAELKTKYIPKITVSDATVLSLT